MELDFDYVIVGAGAAGCVLAARLSENPQIRVALLEAGGRDRSPWLRIPIGFANLYYNRRYNWMYHSAPQPTLENRQIYCPRGKVIGGSGAINAMIFVRGAAEDFNSWAAEGNTGWSYEDTLPYFRKLEDHEAGAGFYHGAGGPIAVTSLRHEAHPLCGAFMQACSEIGVAENQDFNGDSLGGAGYYDVNIRDGKRSSANFEYLRPALKRKNLTVIPHALVKNIVINTALRATAVEFVQADEIKRVTARHEVILCAGAVDTPRILQRSGIGDGAFLRKFDISTRKHLPEVGAQLQDHLCVSYYYRANRRTMNDDFRSKLALARFGWTYLTRRKGAFGMSVNHAGGFFADPAHATPPMLQLYFNALSYRIPTSGRAKLIPEPYSGFLMCYNACRPSSRGRVEITGPDINAPPLIDPRYLTTEKDIKEAIAGGKLIRNLMRTKALQDVTMEEISPGAQIEDEAALLDYFRHHSGSIYHLCGTARMGRDPASSVVDARLRVHGMEGLRIVDASIFPHITSGNIHAPVLMVAEKAASMILEDNR